ncbi:response regulator transcription factor [uncultured Nostoc sp.]|uniref:response regulator transcription factor n=1 Tax=uncultured Nostoc sp. TaxID=340711 RepID=UPI0035CB40C9
MRILIVEDDDRIAKPLAEFLRRQYHIVDITTDGLEAWEWSQSTLYELILLDLMLPKLDGITLCQRLRTASSNVLILMLTARDTTGDKIIGLDAGADDYLVKPFDLKELAARIRALARRTPEMRPQILTHGDLQLDPATQQVTYAGNIILLTPKEYMILEYFLINPNQVITRSIIIDQLWEFDKSSGEGSIKTHITNLRNKLRACGSSEELIENIYGIGYRLGQK